MCASACVRSFIELIFLVSCECILMRGSLFYSRFSCVCVCVCSKCRCGRPTHTLNAVDLPAQMPLQMRGTKFLCAKVTVPGNRQWYSNGWGPAFSARVDTKQAESRMHTRKSGAVSGVCVPGKSDFSEACKQAALPAVKCTFTRALFTLQ